MRLPAASARLAEWLDAEGHERVLRADGPLELQEWGRAGFSAEAFAQGLAEAAALLADEKKDEDDEELVLDLVEQAVDVASELAWRRAPPAGGEPAWPGWRSIERGILQVVQQLRGGSASNELAVYGGVLRGAALALEGLARHRRPADGGAALAALHEVLRTVGCLQAGSGANPEEPATLRSVAALVEYLTDLGQVQELAAQHGDLLLNPPSGAQGGQGDAGPRQPLRTGQEEILEAITAKVAPWAPLPAGPVLVLLAAAAAQEGGSAPLLSGLRAALALPDPPSPALAGGLLQHVCGPPQAFLDRHFQRFPVKFPPASTFLREFVACFASGEVRPA